MFERVRTRFEGSKLIQMSDGSYCIVRDLGPVKGGKGMRHHEVLMTFSFRAIKASIGQALRDLTRRQQQMTENWDSENWEREPARQPAWTALVRRQRGEAGP
jgi:hypothetical protein